MDMWNKRRKISSCLDERKIDRISDLPEPIQRHIFSYLPMEDAIKARTLSKEWKHVRAPLPNFDFDEEQYDKNRKQKNIEDYICQILPLHDGSDIQRFYLRANNSFRCVAHYIEWISFAVKHNVQEVIISGYRLLQIPWSLFTCRTLTKLVLLRVLLRVPEFVEFPMLKVVTLDVMCDDENPLSRLIPNCPKLQNFSLQTFFWDPKYVIDINTATVKYLNLQLSYFTCTVKISAANLQEIKYIGPPPNISPETLSSLGFAHFAFPHSPSTNGPDMHLFCFSANMIFRGLHNVRRLSLNWMFFECLSQAQDPPQAPVIACANLKHLKLEMCSMDCHIYGFLCSLKSFLNLQTLSITFTEKYVQGFLSPGMVSNHSPKMLRMERLQLLRLPKDIILKHLKAVAFFNFEGSEIELILARCILASAFILEEMKIRYSRDMREEEARQRNISQQLVMSTRVSPSAVMSFSLY